LIAFIRHGLLVFAALLVAARLLTGIVYEYDDPTTYLVLKHWPSPTVVQENLAQTPLRQRFSVIDGGENELAYQPAYTFLMNWAFAFAGTCAGAALLLRRRGT
jgi:hypothetical protein